MTERAESSSPRTTPPLFCPHCDYNLTGLAESRCPECGNAFEWDRLLLATERAPQPISIGEAAWRLLWPAGALSLTGILFVLGMGFKIDIVWMFILAAIMFLWGLVIVVLGLINCRTIAQRLAVTRARREGGTRSGLHDRSFIATWFILLYAGQLISAAMALAAAFALGFIVANMLGHGVD